MSVGNHSVCSLHDVIFQVMTRGRLSLLLAVGKLAVQVT
jgi:hypothetical protein